MTLNTITTTDYLTPVRVAHEALSKLIALIPEASRAEADVSVQVLDRTLTAFARALDFQRQVSSNLGWAVRDQEQLAEQIAQIKEG